jgi:hypothetical protein
MKRFYIVILMLVIGRHCVAQGNNSLVISLDEYFETDSISATSVHLTAKPYYINMSMQSKTFVIDNILSLRNKKIAYVRYGHKREIWGKNASNTTILLDNIDLNNSILRKPETESQKLLKHPWFLYFGGQGTFNPQYTNISSDARAGFFLLLNRWDLALSLGWSIMDSGENFMANMPIGLSSKYYFPMTFKDQRISPYFGGGIGYTYMENDNSTEWQFDLSALAGISWAVGPGSLDLGLQYGKVSKFGVTIGYTFFPWGK